MWNTVENNALGWIMESVKCKPSFNPRQRILYSAGCYISPNSEGKPTACV
jgi:hypothetical protein